MPDPPDEEPTLPGMVRQRARAARRPAERPPRTPAADRPVARVLVDVPLAHLDRPFDYLVPAELAEDARPGVRVKVRFAGRDVGGFVVERADRSEHDGRLQYLRTVASPEPVLTPEVAELTAQVATRWAGTRSDVLRLAVPPRHAATEKRPSPPAEPVTGPASPGPWTSYDGGPALLSALTDGRSPRAVWSALPGDDWADLLARAAVATAASGRGALLCVPDRRDLARLDAALTELLGKGRHVVLSAEAGPGKRYGAFLRVVRGAARIVIGTRAAAFAPVSDLGLVAIWDDGDDLHAEPRAPYPHVREVLLLRADATGAAAIVGGHARSVEAAYLLRSGWARQLAGPRAAVRARVQVQVAGASEHDLVRDRFARSARVPRQVHDAVTTALRTGPVLVQTPRAGYATRLACDRCRTPAGCAVCHGPLRIAGPGAPPSCAWCGTPAPGWTCPECGGRGLRAPVIGDRRTAEELGRSFPGVPVRSSSGESALEEVSSRPAIVVATTGAEPPADGGYAAVVLLDTWLLLGRADLRAEEEALRRWCNAAALVRPGGDVVAVGRPEEPALQALVRWAPGDFADRLIGERRSAHLPPASRVATLSAPVAVLEEAVAQLNDVASLPEGIELLGPVAVPHEEARRQREPGDADEEMVRLVARVPRAAGAALASALSDLQRLRSARKLPHVRVQVDPLGLG